METPGRSTTAPQLPASMAKSWRHLMSVPQKNQSSVPMDAHLSKSMMMTDAVPTMNVNVSENVTFQYSLKQFLIILRSCRYFRQIGADFVHETSDITILLIQRNRTGFFFLFSGECITTKST